MIKGVRELVAEANARIGVLSVEEARALAAHDKAVFVDVREPAEIARGTIPGAVLAPRGQLEFVADPGLPAHDPRLSSGRHLVVFCAAGVRSALAASTLEAMGYERVSHIGEGFAGWAASGGEVERP